MARKRGTLNIAVVIEEFLAKVKMGPEYVCTSCHRMMPIKYSKASPELLEKLSEHTYLLTLVLMANSGYEGANCV